MNVFADFHHLDLWESLRILFEERLGWNLYRPIGEEWATSGYWKIAEPYGNHPDTIRQFLSTEIHTWQSGVFLNGDYRVEDGIYHVYDPVHENHQKAITLEQFKNMPIDIVVSSIPAHDFSFANLITEHKPNAKHIAQMGNIYQTTEVKNVMCSTMPYPVPADKNVVFYHQEFDLDTFGYKPPSDKKKITSFVNLLPRKEIYDLYQSQLVEFDFKAYGAGSPDGTITGTKAIAEIMRDSMFGWHIKPQGDGFGHIIHNWFACGRPVITHGSDYQDKLAGALLQDGKTCLDLESCGFNENINRILYWSIPENHLEMCLNAYNRFKEIVNFDEEEKQIRSFLEKII